MAQCIWWLPSIVGLEQGLIVHIDNLRKRWEILSARNEESLGDLAASVQGEERQFPAATKHQAREVSSVPRDIQEQSRINNETQHIHQHRASQVQQSNIDDSDLNIDSSGDEQQTRIVQSTEQFISGSRRQRKKLGNQKQVDSLSKIRSGKIVRPLTKKQREQLQSIAKPTIEEYLRNRKLDLRPYAPIILSEVLLDRCCYP